MLLRKIPNNEQSNYSYLTFQGTINAEMKLKPLIRKAFQEEDLTITFEEKTLDCQKTDYLDVELDLAKHEHYPWRKPNNTILYININSNHPKNIIKQIKPNCEMRLSMLSSSEECLS